MRGDILYKILYTLEDTGIISFNLLLANFRASKGRYFSSSTFSYETDRLDKKHHEYRFDREEKRRMQNYISKLRKEGLVAGKEDAIKISEKGKDKLKKLGNKRKLNKLYYRPQIGKRLIIVSYDLPVAFNKERHIIADILKSLGFNLVHRSVWIGKVKLPADFIEALKNMNVIKFV